MTEEEKKANLKSLIEEYEICYKESKYEGNVEEYKSLKETHKLLKDISELIDRLQKDIEIKDKVIEKIKSKLQKHINFCEQESRGHLENKVCHISLKFEKKLLKEVEKVGKENVKD